MGLYLNNFGENAKGKAKVLIEKHGALPQLIPHYLVPDSGKISVCVVENEEFDAASVAYSRFQFNVFNAPDSRHKIWLTMNFEVVKAIVPAITDYIKEAKEDG